MNYPNVRLAITESPNDIPDIRLFKLLSAFCLLCISLRSCLRTKDCASSNDSAYSAMVFISTHPLDLAKGVMIGMHSSRTHFLKSLLLYLSRKQKVLLDMLDAGIE